MNVGLAPVRISFAGGGTDMPEFYEENGGNVVTSAINRFTYTIIQPRYEPSIQAFSPDFQKHYKPTSFEKIVIQDGTEIATATIKFLNYNTGINVILCSDVPAGSGLGASSSLTVNVINTILKLKREKWTNEKIAETAFYIGRNVLSWPIGKQDEYVSSFGGFNFIEFEKEKIRVSPIILKKSSFNELEKNLLLFFVGHTRNSSKILSHQIKKIKRRDKLTLESLTSVKQLARTMHESLKNSDITKFGELLHKGWSAKKKFAKGVTNSQIDKIYQKGLDSGAIGGKLTGAGGGGHILFYCEERKQKKLLEEMKHLGIKHVDFSFYPKGPTVLNLNDFT